MRVLEINHQLTADIAVMIFYDIFEVVFMSKGQKTNDGLSEKAIVRKGNILNEVRMNTMSLQELRLFSIYLSKINPRDVSTRVVRFPLAEFKRLIDFQMLNLTHLRETFARFLNRVVSVPNEDSSECSSVPLFKKCRLFHDELEQWYVEMEAHDEALPLMFGSKGQYFSYELRNILHLSSANQVRLYEILKQYEKIGTKEIPVTVLKEMLGLDPDEYYHWSNFKIRVLDSCQQALAESTDITFTYEKGKSGRGGKWMTIIFHIQKNEKYAAAEPDMITRLCETCDNAFSYEDMQAACRFAKTFVSDKFIEVYLYQSYLKILVLEDYKKIRNRFQYYCILICKDADRQRKEDERREKNPDYVPSYDIDEYESIFDWDDDE